MGQPLSGPGPYNQIRNQNPMLMPNFDPISLGADSVTGDSITSYPPDQFLANNPRTASSGTLTIGGTVTTGNTITIEVTNNVFPSTSGFSETVTVSVVYTVQGGDTLDTIAEGIAALLSANATLASFGFYATAAGAVVTLHQGSAVGSFTTLADVLSGGATETVTIVQMTGGGGPIIPAYSFEFHPTNTAGYGAVLNFYANRPVIVDYWTLKQIVDQGYPVY